MTGYGFWARQLGTRLALALALLGSPAAAQDLDAILANPNGHDVVDALPDGQRQNVIRGLSARLEDDTTRVGQLLCAVLPWTTGDNAQDDDLQQLAWRLMLEEPNAETIDFRWLDCVAANRRGAYRARVLDPMFEMRQAFCSGRPLAFDYPTLLRNIRTFDQSVADGISSVNEGGTDLKYSYFPVRNALRLANLAAGLAVERWPDDPTDARIALGKAADELDAVLEQLDVVNTRNGWRMRNELAFHAELYRWLGGGGNDEALNALGDQLAVLADPALEDARDAGFFEGVPDDYVEQIFIERLLPGAQASDPDTECSQWRRRSYDPRALVDAVMACERDRGDLIAFDRCMVDFEASDWRIQYTSVRRVLGDRGIGNETARIEAAIDQVLGALAQQDADVNIESLRRRMAVEHEIDRNAGRTVFSSVAENFTTSERQLLGSAFSRSIRSNIEPLFRRPQVY